jgi:F5/8 type C domain
MTKQLRGRRGRRAATGIALAATLAFLAGSLTATVSAASAQTTTTTTVPAATTTTVASPNCSAAPSGTALGRTGWVASTNSRSSGSDVPGNAIDGNPNTRFSTDQLQAPGLYFEVNLGSAQSFDELEMDVPNSANDYARGYNVEVSANGSSWTTVASCTGTGTPEVVSFPTQTAQYVQVVLTASNPSYWWSIDEFYLYTSTPPTTTTTTTSTTTTSTTTTTTVPTTTTTVPAHHRRPPVRFCLVPYRFGRHFVQVNCRPVRLCPHPFGMRRSRGYAFYFCLEPAPAHHRPVGSAGRGRGHRGRR